MNYNIPKSIVIVTFLLGVVITGLIFLNPRTEPVDDTLIDPENAEKPTQIMTATTSSLSDEKLTALWANGERCPKEIFMVQPDPNKISWLPIKNSIGIQFDDSATCTDVEQIAQFLNAKIVGGDSSWNSYGFKNDDWTDDNVITAIEKIKSLHHQKIIIVFKSFSTILE